MKRIFIVFLFSSTLVTFINAQNIVVSGVIKNIVHKEALPFANIYLQKNHFGTVSNSNGKFKIVIPKVKSNDSLVVSFIGYYSQKFKISSITNPLIIFLEENTTTLNEVVVTRYTAATIIKKAIEKIPTNYYTDPYKLKGFYRLTSQKDNSYIHLSEAVFNIYQSTRDNKKQQFRVEKVRAIKDEKASRGIDLGLKPSGIFEFDIVNDQTGLLNKKGVNQHIFKIEGTVLINGQEAYKIVFDQKDIKKSAYKGYVLIDKETLAFVYFNYGLSPKGLKYHKFGDASLRAIMKIIGINITMNRDNNQIQYKKINGKYYLNNASNDATLTFKSDREHYNFKAETRVDYLVTKIETDNISPFSNDETLGQGKLIEKQNSIYDTNFWEDYTIILPTSNFSDIARKLEANNKAIDFKVVLEDRLHKLSKNKPVRIDSILSFYNQKNLFSGNALIAYKGKTIFQKSYNNDMTLNNPTSQFRIGSLSKTFTAMIIAQLENKNKLNYSDEIEKYLPNYQNGKVTIGELLSHQSGIPNFLANKTYLSKILTNKYSIEEVVSLFCSDTLEFEPSSKPILGKDTKELNGIKFRPKEQGIQSNGSRPASKFEYSNSNFVILSLIAEKIIGLKYRDVLNQFIFKPLNMNATYFGEPTDSTHLVTGYMYDKPEPKYYAQNVGGAGGITSTTSDLLKWSIALSNEKLLPQSKINQLFQPQAEYIDWDAFYGYGWMIDRYMFYASKKHKIYYHPGTDFGFYSMFAIQPDNGITIILLSNTGEFSRFEITDLILKELN